MFGGEVRLDATVRACCVVICAAVVDGICGCASAALYAGVTWVPSAGAVG